MEKNEELALHKKFAVDIFNDIWGIIGDKNISDEQKAVAIDMAHASLHHWRQCGDDLNLQRGHWMISNVYSLFDFPDSAFYHAEICLELTRKNNYKGFDLAYAYEAMARSSACGGKKNLFDEYYELASEAGNAIEKKEDKDLFLSDLKKGPWYESRVP